MTHGASVFPMTKRGFGSIYQQRKRRPDGTVAVLPTWWIKYSKNGQVSRESSGSHDERGLGDYSKSVWAKW
jgi:hypothetical protein